MRLKKILACCSLMAAALNASAGIELSFEDRGTTSSALGNPYTGITFVGNPYTFGSVSAVGGTGKFQHMEGGSPSLTNVVALMFIDPAIDPEEGFIGQPGRLIINVDAGFSTVFQMLYTTFDSWTGTNVQVFSGLNGKGDPLGLSAAFSALGQGGCAAEIACNWGDINIDLGTSIAHSVVISGPNAVYFFDNIFFGDLPGSTGGTDVPEPTGGALALAALGALAISRRRKS